MERNGPQPPGRPRSSSRIAHSPSTVRLLSTTPSGSYAADTASAQGWRRPLLAWLDVQARLADERGDAAEAARLRRRMGLVEPPR